MPIRNWPVRLALHWIGSPACCHRPCGSRWKPAACSHRTGAGRRSNTGCRRCAGPSGTDIACGCTMSMPKGAPASASSGRSRWRFFPKALAGGLVRTARRVPAFSRRPGAGAVRHRAAVSRPASPPAAPLAPGMRTTALERFLRECLHARRTRTGGCPVTFAVALQGPRHWMPAFAGMTAPFRGSLERLFAGVFACPSRPRRRVPSDFRCCSTRAKTLDARVRGHDGSVQRFPGVVFLREYLHVRRARAGGCPVTFGVVLQGPRHWMPAFAGMTAASGRVANHSGTLPPRCVRGFRQPCCESGLNPPRKKGASASASHRIVSWN